MKIVGMIPARLGSTRLPAKVLELINGKPMIQHVWDRVSQAKKISEVWIACDDEQIVKAAESFGAKTILTRKDHPNGTSRIAEAIQKVQADVVINIQGDEPRIHPEVIDQLAAVFEKKTAVKMATCAVCKKIDADFQSQDVVKLVRREDGRALYFSRSPIPFEREGKTNESTYLKHLGIYGYCRDFLLEFIGWKPSRLEQIEKLEQLRALENGVEIEVIEVTQDSVSVDTPKDLEEVRKQFSAK